MKYALLMQRNMDGGKFTFMALSDSYFESDIFGCWVISCKIIEGAGLDIDDMKIESPCGGSLVYAGDYIFKIA